MGERFEKSFISINSIDDQQPLFMEDYDCITSDPVGICPPVLPKTRFLLSYWPKRVGDSMLKSTQPDLINPVRYLTWLDADGVIPGMLQNDGNGIIRITCPAIDTKRMDIPPIP